MPRREHWGTYVTPEGENRHMIRGARNRTWFEDDAGEVVSPVQSNIFPAMCWMYAETEWVDPTSPAWLQAGCQAQVRERRS